MQPQEIHINDWVRIFVGAVPGTFYVELIIRAFFIYLLLMVSMRMLGKRVSSGLGPTELVAIVTLAAAIGVPLQAPDRGLLPGAVIAVIVVYIGRYIANRSFLSQRFERFIQGDISLLISDSVIDIKALRHTNLTRERLISELRSSGIRQLGEVKRLYIEAGGSFTLIKMKEPSPGLYIMPAWDHEMCNRLQHFEDMSTCKNCGLTTNKVNSDEKCSNCGKQLWGYAVK